MATAYMHIHTPILDHSSILKIFLILFHPKTCYLLGTHKWPQHKHTYSGSFFYFLNISNNIISVVILRRAILL